MAKKRKGVKRVSLLWELDLLRRAVMAAAMLAELQSTEQFESAAQAAKAPLAISAMLTLIEMRLALVEAVARGERDAEVLVHSVNDAGDMASEVVGVVLKSKPSGRVG